MSIAPRLLQHKAAAQLLGIGPAQLSALVRAGEFVPIRMSEGQSSRRLYEVSELKDYIARRGGEADLRKLLESQEQLRMARKRERQEKKDAANPAPEPAAPPPQDIRHKRLDYAIKRSK